MSLVNQTSPDDRGDSGAATEDFVRYYSGAYPRVLAFIFSLLPDRGGAEEVLQETSLLLWRKFGEFDRDRDFVAWACGIALNQVRRYRREQARTDRRLSDQVLDEVAAVHSRKSVELDARNALLRNCVDRLSEKDRQLIQQCYQGDATIQSVAVRLGRSVHTAYKALKRIRMALHDCVTRALRAEGSP